MKTRYFFRLVCGGCGKPLGEEKEDKMANVLDLDFGPDVHQTIVAGPCPVCDQFCELAISRYGHLD